MAPRKREAKPRTEDLLTVQQFAEELQVDATTVRRWIKKGIIKAIELPHAAGAPRIGKRIRRGELEKYLHPAEEEQEETHGD